MPRLSQLAQVPAVLLAVAMLLACERSSTGPAPATTPSFSVGSTADDGQLQAPGHAGGRQVGTMGSGGGHLHFVDSSTPGIEYWLDVPAGALSTSASVQLEVLPGDRYLVSLRATSAAGEDVGRKGFGQPVRLTISYATTRTAAPPPRLFIACIPDDGGAPVVVKSQVNPGQLTVTGFLPHFSHWSIIAN